MDEKITEALRASQPPHRAPPPPGVDLLERRVRGRRLRDAGFFALTASLLLWSLPLRPAPPSGPSPAVRDAAAAEALGEVLDDLDLLAEGPADDDLVGTQLAMLDPYGADTGMLPDPLNLDGEL